MARKVVENGEIYIGNSENYDFSSKTTIEIDVPTWILDAFDDVNMSEKFYTKLNEKVHELFDFIADNKDTTSNSDAGFLMLIKTLMDDYLVNETE